MKNFYLAVCRNRFYVYDGETRQAEHIDGNPFVEYEPNKAREGVRRLVTSMLENRNKEDRWEFHFDLIESTDGLLNEAVTRELAERDMKRYAAADLVGRAINDLLNDPKLHVRELGVNYDGECYYAGEDLMRRGEYSLTALTLTPEALLKYVG